MKLNELVLCNKKLDDVLMSINDIANDRDSVYFGLPMYNAELKALMVKAVQEWCMKLVNVIKIKDLVLNPEKIGKLLDELDRIAMLEKRFHSRKRGYGLSMYGDKKVISIMRYAVLVWLAQAEDT